MTGTVIHALIPAAGRGARFGGSVMKQYLPVAGKTVIEHAINAINVFPEIAGITVILAKEDNRFTQLFDLETSGINTVEGGASRAESVMNGLKSIRRTNPETEWVLVHDAARPCLPKECLKRLLQQGLDSTDGAILALPVADSLKESDDAGRISRSVDRARLWAAQTPQLFPLATLSSALQSMLDSGAVPTDEAGAIETAGGSPLLVTGSSVNIKITRPEDVHIAESWFEGLSKEPDQS